MTLPNAIWPSRPAGIPAAGAAAAAVAGVRPLANRMAGVADAQVGGTDSLPTVFASPTPTETAPVRPAPADRRPSPAPNADFGMSRPSTGSL